MNQQRIDNAVLNLKKILDEEGLDCRSGLTDMLFLLVSSMTPIPNIDLFVVDDKKHRFLLVWRDDAFYGKGWHIPGGCIRIMESFDDRIQKTAENELGSNIIYETKPIMVTEALASEERIQYQGNLVRSHNISVLFKGVFPEEFDISKYNIGKAETEQGYLKWFDSVPENFLDCQRPMYENFLREWCSCRDT